MSEFSNQEQGNTTPERKKISLQEAIQQKLAHKKEQQSQGRNNANFSHSNQKMRSQQTKKANNQRRRTGV